MRAVVVKTNAARTKGGVVVFGKLRAQHYREKQARHWKLDGNGLAELYEYKSRGAVKNYVCSSRLDICEATEKLERGQECFSIVVLVADNLIIWS